MCLHLRDGRQLPVAVRAPAAAAGASGTLRPIGLGRLLRGRVAHKVQLPRRQPQHARRHALGRHQQALRQEQHLRRQGVCLRKSTRNKRVQGSGFRITTRLGVTGMHCNRNSTCAARGLTGGTRNKWPCSKQAPGRGCLSQANAWTAGTFHVVLHKSAGQLKP